MAGVKGRSGGARKGAGRKPKRTRSPAPAASASADSAGPMTQPPATPTTDAKEFLEAVIAGRVFASEEQIAAAKALLPFQHKKLGETGKKEQKKEDAGKVSRFAPAPPRLALIHGKKH